MRKKEFLDELRGKLEGLSESDREDRIAFYSEMIDDRIDEGKSESEAIREIGSVNDIVEQIAQSTSLVRLVKERVAPKRSLKDWEIVLLILSFPLWFPLLVTVLALVFTFYTLIWVFVIVTFAVEFSLIATGACGIVVFFAYLIDNSSLNLIALGSSLLGFGGAIIMLFACVFATKITLKMSKKILLTIKMSFIKKGETK